MTIRPALERALRPLDTTDPSACWLWPNAVSIGGYALLRATSDPADGNAYVHRVMFEAFIRPIPGGMQIDHVCHTEALAAGRCDAGICEHRRCVNPWHLEAVTARENVLRGGSAAAVAALRDACSNGHEYTPENTYLYRNRRQCRECRRIHREAWRARSKAGGPDSLPRKSGQFVGGGSHA